MANSSMSFLFDRGPFWTPCDDDVKASPYVLRAPTTRMERRFERLQIPASQLPALVLDVGAQVIVQIQGWDTDASTIRFCAEVAAAAGAQSAHLLEDTRLVLKDGVLTLAVPSAGDFTPLCYIVAIVPRGNAVKVTGVRSAVEVYDVSAPVVVRTTGALVRLLDTTGDVDVTALQGGHVVFAGNCGRVRLRADAELAVKLTGDRFDGALNAAAEGCVRVLLPSAFRSAFEVDVMRRDDCSIGPGLMQPVGTARRESRVVFTFGSGDPLLRFSSVGAAVELALQPSS